MNILLQAEDGIRVAQKSHELGDVYERQVLHASTIIVSSQTQLLQHGKPGTLEHFMNCKKGGLVTARHNEIRDLCIDSALSLIHI